MFLVAGLGQTGQSVLRYFARLDEPCLAFDTRADFETKPLKQMFKQASFATGKLPDAWRDKITCIVLSPGIAKSEPWVNELVQAGIEVVGDIELFSRSVGQPIVAITGSNGKSTVTTLVGEMLREAGYQVGVGGNIGLPVLDLLGEEVPDFDVFVLELSSFQLETTYSLQATTATVLNICEDHLDRYDSYESYIAAKIALLRMTEMAVLPEEATWQLPDQKTLRFGGSEDVPFGVVERAGKAWLTADFQPVMPVAEMALQGRHHQLNALASMALCQPFEVDFEVYKRVLGRFIGLPHRTQLVAEHHQVQWINDSKGTNVGATVTALETLGPPLVEAGNQLILIAGGVGKEANFADLFPAVAAYVAQTFLLGQDAPLIQQALENQPVTLVGSLQEAICLAGKVATPGDCILFSPACASFDQFENYVDRGLKFEQWVRTYLEDAD